jgi:DNA-binding NarL/FixJ family response regulator
MKLRELMKILIADGSLEIADRLASALKELPGIGIITHASDAAGVVSSIKVDRPDVAIVDPRIAGNGGIELLRSIKRLRPRVVLIVVSNLICRAHGRRCLKAGADYFLDKSTEFNRVIEVVWAIQTGV